MWAEVGCQAARVEGCNSMYARAFKHAGAAGDDTGVGAGAGTQGWRREGRLSLSVTSEIARAARRLGRSTRLQSAEAAPAEAGSRGRCGDVGSQVVYAGTRSAGMTPVVRVVGGAIEGDVNRWKEGRR